MFKSLSRHGMRAGALAVAALSLAVSGCGGPDIQTETFKSSGIAEGSQAPSWVEGTPSLWAQGMAETGGQAVQRVDNAENRVFVVGRAIGHNVLDEANAHQQAIDDAIRQLARQVHTRTTDHRMAKRTDKGPEFFPGEQYTAKTEQAVKADTQAITRYMEEHDVYWERWEVRHGENPGSGTGLTRWKCWVLMSVTEDELDMLAQQTALRHAREAAAPSKLYQVANQ